MIIYKTFFHDINVVQFPDGSDPGDMKTKEEFLSLPRVSAWEMMPEKIK